MSARMEPTTADQLISPSGFGIAPPPGPLTPRESDLLQQAGERVFVLARRLAAAERQEQEAKRSLDHLQELLQETRSTRDILAAQVQSLLRERERDYEERSELRQLLGAITAQLQTAMTRGAAVPAEGERRALAGTGAPPAAATRRRPSRVRSSSAASDGLTSLVGAARERWTRWSRR